MDHVLKLLQLSGIALCFGVGPGHSAGVASQAYPTKPIRLIVGQQAGSALDNSVRVITPAIGDTLGQPIVVDNRSGVGGMIAMQLGVAASADGHTIINAGTPQMIAPFLFKKLGYDLFTDFVAIARLTVTQNALVVNTGLPAANVRALIELATAKPGQINMASAGPASASHLAGTLFNTTTGINALHLPYKGGAAAVTAVLSNEAQYLLTPLAAVIAHIRAGRLRAIGVGGATRAIQLPEVPTIDEAGVKGFRSTGWNGLFAPKGLPQAISAQLVAAVTAALGNQKVIENIVRAGVEPGLLIGAEYVQFMRDELQRFGAAVKAAGLKPE